MFWNTSLRDRTFSSLFRLRTLIETRAIQWKCGNRWRVWSGGMYGSIAVARQLQSVARPWGQKWKKAFWQTRLPSRVAYDRNPAGVSGTPKPRVPSRVRRPAAANLFLIKRQWRTEIEHSQRDARKSFEIFLFDDDMRTIQPGLSLSRVMSNSSTRSSARSRHKVLI